MFFWKSNKKKIELLKKRDQEIENKYLVDDETDDMGAIARQGYYLGIHEQLLRILHRNTDNIPEDIKNTDFFKVALVTYIDLYCRIIVASKFPEGVDDIANITLSKFYDMDYEKIVSLPNSIAYTNENWVTGMAKNISIFGVQNTALLVVIESMLSTTTGKTVRFGVAEENKPTVF